MKEEDVDQYFKNKFNQFTPVPAADVWARLQSKMDPPQKKQSLMWVYYAAAVMSVMLLSGALYFYLNTSSVNPTNSLTKIKPILVPLQVETNFENTLADAATKAPSVLPTVEPPANDKTIKTTIKNNNAATPTTTSKPVKKGKKIRPGILVAGAKSIPYTNRPESTSTNETETQLAAGPGSTPSTALPATDDQVMEVIIRKDAEIVAAANPKDANQTVKEVIKENVSKKGRLVKNIFKQARNLKNGEKVELSTLGLNANYRIDVESKLFKQKYTKVINL